MMTFEQVQNLLNNMGLIATIARNGKDIATVKAVVIKIHNKSHKVLSVAAGAEDLFFQGTYNDYV